MTANFEVSIGELKAAASQLESGATELEGIAAQIADPDPMMAGLFLAPLVGMIAPLITQGARQLITGAGTMNQTYARNLNNSAQSYADVEAANVALTANILKEL